MILEKQFNNKRKKKNKFKSNKIYRKKLNLKTKKVI